MSAENDAWAAYIRGLKVAPNMTNCRQFVDLMASTASKGVFDTVAIAKAQSAAMLEVINALGDLDERLRKSGM